MIKRMKYFLPALLMMLLCALNMRFSVNLRDAGLKQIEGRFYDLKYMNNAKGPDMWMLVLYEGGSYCIPGNIGFEAEAFRNTVAEGQQLTLKVEKGIQVNQVYEIESEGKILHSLEQSRSALQKQSGRYASGALVFVLVGAFFAVRAYRKENNS